MRWLEVEKRDLEELPGLPFERTGRACRKASRSSTTGCLAVTEACPAASRLDAAQSTPIGISQELELSDDLHASLIYSESCLFPLLKLLQDVCNGHPAYRRACAERGEVSRCLVIHDETKQGVYT